MQEQFEEALMKMRKGKSSGKDGIAIKKNKRMRKPAEKYSLENLISDGRKAKSRMIEEFNCNANMHCQIRH